jgi:hypothetical protein
MFRPPRKSTLIIIDASWRRDVARELFAHRQISKATWPAVDPTNRASPPTIQLDSETPERMGTGSESPHATAGWKPTTYAEKFERAPSARGLRMSRRKAARWRAPRRSRWNFPPVPPKISIADAMGGVRPPGTRHHDRGDCRPAVISPRSLVFPARSDCPARYGNFLGLGGVSKDAPVNRQATGASVEYAPGVRTVLKP